MTHPPDSFASRYDGPTSIGCACDDGSLVGAAELVGASHRSLVGALEAYFDGYDDMVGATLVGTPRFEVIGSGLSFDLKAGASGGGFVDTAKKVKSAVDTAASAVQTGAAMAKSAGITGQAGAPDKGWQDAAAGIRAVTRNPITHAAIAAVACVVPYGTVAAAVAEVGVGVAEGVALIADELGKWCPWCGPTPEQRAAAAAEEEKKRKEAEKKRLAVIAAAEKKAQRIQEKKAREAEMKRVAAAKARLLARAAEQKRKAEEARKKKDAEERERKRKIERLSNELEDKLAKIYVFAAAGDERAMKRLIAFQMETNKDLSKSKIYTKARAQGHTHGGAWKIMEKMGKNQPDFWQRLTKDAMAKAKKLRKDPKIAKQLAELEADIKAKKIKRAKKPNFKGLTSTINAGAAVMLAQARMVADKRGGVRGVLVSGQKSYGGHFVQSDDPKSPVGVVVLASGKPVKGRWKALAA